MKIIPISCSKPHKDTVPGCALVDEEDFDLLIKWKWSRSGQYATRKDSKSGKTIFMHRVIMNKHPEMEVDHIDGNGLNNQRKNLRYCTRSQNAWNRKMTAKTGSKGARFYKQTNRFLAVISKHGIKHHIGYFPTLIEAQIAYNKAAFDFHGSFARLNPVVQ